MTLAPNPTPKQVQRANLSGLVVEALAPGWRDRHGPYPYPYPHP